MGRRQYLERLALGRSPYQPVVSNQDEADARNVHGGSATTTTTTGRAAPASTWPDNVINDGVHVQQYDDKARPTNAASEAFEAAQRQAMNEVLALVGVVEKKDQTHYVNELRWKYIHTQRQHVLVQEYERGALFEYAIIPVAFFAHLWSDAFRQRIQIGAYRVTRSLAQVFRSEWSVIFSAPASLSLATCFPAVGDTIMHALIKVPLIVALEQVTGQLQEWVGKCGFSRKATDSISLVMNVSFEMLLFAIDVAVLPLEYQASARKLGLAPPLPLFSPVTSFFPWRGDGFHRFGWQPLLNVPILRCLTSPAALLMVHKYIHYNVEDTETPILSLLSKFRYPPINNSWVDGTEDGSLTQAPTIRTDLTGWLLFNCYRLRCRILRACGWNLISRSEGSQRRPLGTFDANTCIGADQTELPPPIYRSTTLAHLPAQFFADTIDKFFSRLITLPFESLMLRAIAQSYLTSSMTAKTVAGLSAAPHIYTPFGGGCIAALLRSPTSASRWTEVGQYASHIGLSLALTAAVDTILFFGIYGSVRHFGTKYFDWGRRGKMGSIIYTEEGLDNTAHLQNETTPENL